MSASSAGGDKREPLRPQLGKDESTCAHLGPRHASEHFSDPLGQSMPQRNTSWSRVAPLSTPTDHEHRKVIAILSPCVSGFWSLLIAVDNQNRAAQAAKVLVERRAERGSLRSEDVDNILLLLEIVTEPEMARKE